MIAVKLIFDGKEFVFHRGSIHWPRNLNPIYKHKQNSTLEHPLITRMDRTKKIKLGLVEPRKMPPGLGRRPAA